MSMYNPFVSPFGSTPKADREWANPFFDPASATAPSGSHLTPEPEGLSAEQHAALRAVHAWLVRGQPQVFRLFGPAGTGKTTLAQYIAASINGEVVFAAFTGKAASVMRAKGCAGATMIHSLIYRTTYEDGQYQSVWNPDSPAARAPLIIIDECSMVDAKLGNDLLRFGRPVLVLGDPFQLQPVEGAGFFTKAKPDVLLTEIHRQAKDNPIIQLATDVRQGKALKAGTYGESGVLPVRELSLDQILAADQLLVARNDTRRRFNRRMRELLGRDDALPVAGDKLVCLRNNPAKSLFNGTIWTVTGRGVVERDRVTLRLAPEDGSGPNVDVEVHRDFYVGDDEAARKSHSNTDAFTYGYALTVHKAQGSQWDRVMLFDESDTFREEARNWLYTGLTRAAKSVIVATGMECPTPTSTTRLGSKIPPLRPR
jgi:exodeoxyribonuclease V